jgi:hypothetical protein
MRYSRRARTPGLSALPRREHDRGEAATIHLRGNADGVATGAGKLWVATDTSVVRIDPQTDTHSTTVHPRLPPSGIAYYDGKLWLTIQ